MASNIETNLTDIEKTRIHKSKFYEILETMDIPDLKTKKIFYAKGS